MRNLRDGNTHLSRWKRHRRSRAWRVGPLLVAALTLGLLTVVACGSDEPTTTAEPTAISEPMGPDGQKYGGTLRIAGTPTHITLDPPLLTASMDVEIAWAVYDGLVRRMPDMSYKPTLATSWDISDDLTQWTFQLRRDVKFHNGKEFKAEDVVYNFTRIVDPDVGSPAADQFSGVENIVAVDDYTVRFELSRPNAFFLDALAVYHARIIPKGIDIETLTNGAVGTGPFTLEEYVVGEFATLKRNPNYWDEGLPYLDEVTFLFMAEDASRLQVLKAGDVDVEYSPAMTSINEIENDPGIVATMVSSASYQNLVMNTTKPPFDDKLVRNAFQLATDRELINQATMFGYGTIANDHAIPPTDPLYATDVAIPPYDPAGARALLELAGYMNGIDVDLHTMARYGLDDLAVAFKESAEPAGIRVNIIRDPEDTYWGDVWMQYPFVTSNWSGRPPVVAFGLYYKSGVAWNESFYSNPELDALLAQAEGEPDLEARKVMFSRMQEMLVDDAPVIIGTFQPVMWFNRDYVKGIEAHPLWMFYLHEAWLDK